MSELDPVDADMLWRSMVGVTDQFLLYAFEAGVIVDAFGPEQAAQQVVGLLRERAGDIDDLQLKVALAPFDLAYPRWVTTSIEPGAVVHHPGPADWDSCRAEVGRLLTQGVDATDLPWRIHVFGPISGVPRSEPDGEAWVVVLQISHALADGRRASEIARALFGGHLPEPGPEPSDEPGLVDSAVGAAMAPVRFAEGIGRGLLAWRAVAADPTEPWDGVPATRLNVSPGPGRRIDMIVTEVDAVRRDGYSVTVGALTLLADVLADYLPDSERIAVELPVARTPRRRPNGNDFHNVGVDLHADIADPEARARAIADDIAAARAKDEREARRAQRRAADVTPASLRALAVRQTDLWSSPENVTGVTVVSSVNRGPADLTLAGGHVLFTAGFPALSPAHAMTIGIHGIGSTITFSITTGSAVDDDGEFARLLAAALGA